MRNICIVNSDIIEINYFFLTRNNNNLDNYLNWPEKKIKSKTLGNLNKSKWGTICTYIFCTNQILNFVHRQSEPVLQLFE